MVVSGVVTSTALTATMQYVGAAPKQLIVGRLDMTPNREEWFYLFRGTGTLLPTLAGAVPPSMASLTGFVPEGRGAKRRWPSA